MHVHGGVGIDLDGEAHRYFTAAKRLEFALGGTTDQAAHRSARCWPATPPEMTTVRDALLARSEDDRPALLAGDDALDLAGVRRASAAGARTRWPTCSTPTGRRTSGC